MATDAFNSTNLSGLCNDFGGATARVSMDFDSSGMLVSLDGGASPEVGGADPSVSTFTM
ncbi:MAG: hypothetical protein ACRBCK_04735 [Alphaproteobacteria bacterium]